MLLPRIGIASKGRRNTGLRDSKKLVSQIDNQVVDKLTKPGIEGQSGILRVQARPGNRRTTSHRDTSPAARDGPRPAAGLTGRAPESHNPVKAAERGHPGPPSASSLLQQCWTHS